MAGVCLGVALCATLIWATHLGRFLALLLRDSLIYPCVYDRSVVATFPTPCPQDQNSTA